MFRFKTVAAALLIGSVASESVAQQAPQVVRSTSAPLWGPSLRLVEEVRIGRLDGASEYLLGNVTGVAVGRDGVIFVADRIPLVRMYDAPGRFIRNVGAKGEGPGEYAAIAGIRTLIDGRLAIWDNRNARIALFTPTGDFATVHRVETASDIFQVDRSGRFYVRGVIGRGGGPSSPQLGWIRVSPAGQVVDTLAIPIDSAAAPSFVISTPSGADRPFPRELLSTVSSMGYLITGRNDTYSFDLNRPGAPVLRIERPFTPVRLGRAEKAEWDAWAMFFERLAATPPPATPGMVPLQATRVDYTIPDTKPAYSELRTDSQGRIWVRRYVEAVSSPGPERAPGDARPRRVWREPPTFDVFEPTGQFLGTITLPFNAAVHDAIDRHLWVTIRGDADEPYVVRLRIEPLPG